MKPDNHQRQNRKLAGFYLYVATICKHSPVNRATREQIAAKYDADTAFSWLQWSDAKQWFSSSTGYYYLNQSWANASLPEIYQSIKSHYGI